MPTTKPFVSVIVPVYNSEKYLYRCLDSLVCQSLENIEIICVNNGSEDTSIDILNEYQALFPNKVFVHSTEHFNHVAHGRNVGMRQARAEYITFCDSDDMMHLRALEWMYKIAVEKNADLVFTPYWRFMNRVVTVNGKYNLKKEPEVENLLISASPSVWAKLIHRSLINKIGEIPEVPAEDVAYSFLLHTYAERICYLAKPTYYYINRSDSEIRTFLSTKKVESMAAQNYGIQHGNPEYREAILANVGRLLERMARDNWVFTDQYIKRAKELWPQLCDNQFFITRYRSSYESLKKYVERVEEPFDTVVYVNGFDEDMVEDRSRVADNAFFNGTKTVILNKENCKISENIVLQTAYENGDYDFVAKYFALERIYEHGGVYIGKRIKIDAPINYTRCFPAFFGYLDDTSFTDEIFGGVAGSHVIRRILETYSGSGMYSNKRMPLCERIRNILVAAYDVPLDRAKTRLFDYQDFALFAPDVFVADPSEGLGALFPKLHLTTHDFSDCVESDERDNYVVIPYSTLRSLYTNAVREGAEPHISKIARLERELKKRKRELNELQNSYSWKLTKPLRHLRKLLRSISGWFSRLLTKQA